MDKKMEIITMKRVIEILVLLLLLSFFARQFYTVSNSYIIKQAWLYGGGYHFTDGFTFSNNDAIVNDTIFIANTPKAVILNRGYRSFIPNYLTVKDLKSTQTGTYHEK